MALRLEYWKISPEAEKSLASLYRYFSRTEPEPNLLNLVYLRVSQINGCSYCVDLHYREAVGGGEDGRRLNAVSAWREAPFFSRRERAALEWAEALTLLDRPTIPDDVYERAHKHFGAKELSDLSYAIALMNAYNRMAMAFRRAPDAKT